MAKYNEHQIAVARAIIKVGKSKRITPRGIIGGIACGMVESNLQVLANPKDPPSMKLPHVGLGYDSLSSGVFQQQPGKTWNANPSWWGTVECRMDPECSAGQFFDRLAKLNYNNLGRSIGRYVQDVQQSSFPDRYDQHVSAATHLYDQLVNTVTPSAPPPPRSPGSRVPYQEIAMFGSGASARSRPPTNFFFHTEEGNGSAKSLAQYCQGQNGVSYHYTVRDRIVYDVVDTDLYSWSVLSANAFSINLCFAGSRAAFSRQQWLDRVSDIEIACYLAVQDCKKYNFSTRVIVPPYTQQGAGIADHKYVTQALRIGNHTDVGPNFPWDKVIEFVNYYAGEVEDDMFTDHDRYLLQVLAEQRFKSRSPFRRLGEGFVETVAGFAINIDGMEHFEHVIQCAKLGDKDSYDLLKEVAGAEGNSRYPDRQKDAKLAKLALADVDRYLGQTQTASS